MDRKLINYLPPVLREVLELKAVNEANEPEISLAWDALALVMANQFLEEADEWGVAVWEKELKIFPRDTDSMELRKARIKAMWNMKTPYTFPWLKQWMTEVFGADRHTEEMEDYTLAIQLWQDLSADTKRKTEEFFDLLLKVIPENILLSLTYTFPTISTSVPIRSTPGPRVGSSALQPYRPRLPPGKFCVTPVLGASFSTITLPMAVGRPPDRSFAGRPKATGTVVRRSQMTSPANDGPMAAHEGG